MNIWTPAVIVNLGRKPTLHVDVLNTGDTDAPAPFIQIRATNVKGSQKTRTLMGGADTLPSLLPPDFFDTAKIPYDLEPIGNGVVSTFTLHVLNPSDPVDWDSEKETFRPTTIPPDAWDAIWSNFRPLLGNTLADLYTLLRRDADQLAQLALATNSPELFTTSIERLFKFELRKANDLPAVPVPAGTVDLAFPAPGLPLVFAPNTAHRLPIGFTLDD